MSLLASYVWLSGIVGLITLLAVGGNDVANSQATAVGAKALSFKGAVILAAICEFLGASLMGGAVSHALGDEVLDHNKINDTNYVWGMFSSLLGAGIWLSIATVLSIPVSSTHSIVGSLIGFGLVVTNFNVHRISWDVIGPMAIAWIITPLMAFLLSDFMLQGLELFLPTPKRKKVDRNDPKNHLLSPKLMSTEKSETTTSIKKLSNHIFNNNNEENEENEEDTDGQYDYSLIDTDQNTKEFRERLEKFKSRKKKSITEFQVIYTYGAQPPLPFKFGFLLAIIISIIFLFLLVGGPPEMKRLYRELNIFILIGIILFIFLLFFIIGYFLEKPYRLNFIKHKYNNKKSSLSTSIKSKTKTIKDDIADNLPNPDDKFKNEGEIGVVSDLLSSILPYDEGTINQFVTEDYFALFLIIASGAVSFAHGGNDIANVIGPFGAIYHYNRKGNLTENFKIPIYIYMFGGCVVVIGFMIFGKGVLHTIGTTITKLRYRAGFAAQMSAAITVLIATVSGIPVSTTTVIVGAVTGVGYYRTRQLRKQKLLDVKEEDLYQDIDESSSKMSKYCQKLAKDLKKLNFKTLAKILAYWVITLPLTAIIGGSTYKIVSLIRKAT